MQKARPRLKSVRRKIVRRKIVFIAFAILSTMYLAERTHFDPAGAVSAPTFDVREVEVIKEVEVPVVKTYTTEREEIMAYILEVFGSEAHRAIWVANCESGLRKDAINKANNNGTTDYGVFQINSVHIKRYGKDFTTDWQENVRVAKKIYDAQGFTPWVCAKSIGEKNYLSK